MMKFVKNKLKEEKGLTLIELLAVIVILGIIAAIAIPAIGNVIENSRYNAVKGDALNILSAANIYIAENEIPSEGIKPAQLDSYLESPGKVTEYTVTREDGDLVITTAAGVEYSGNKTVKFTNASVAEINADDQSGSSDNNKTIPGGGTTEPPVEG
ncbi:prepilin-type N-terminal cleavage/methylation domain-containing protein [Bhargavaea massiliensis]|uniref:prepilin-type N-terminal cleavage/methylation domain-containing protein n=1 Tax=Bhargavaea massiliensis TaxID=2697500 RepID=UPI001BCE53B2|nr:prepilin-type N-terminal cleavage/methylation domain-containing protein [Bhargavaea massiliensis]